MQTYYYYFTPHCFLQFSIGSSGSITVSRAKFYSRQCEAVFARIIRTNQLTNYSRE